MTKEQLIAAVSEHASITQEEAGKVIDAITEEIKEELSRGGKVVIAGFGTFVISQRGEKTFVNPKTGQTSKLPERALPHFKASADFKKNLGSTT
jgi:DNA-binding protein HU-beta